MKNLFYVMFSLMLISCGSASYYAPQSGEASHDMMMMNDEVGKETPSLAPPSPSSKRMMSPKKSMMMDDGDMGQPETAEASPQKDEQSPIDPMIVYNGFLKLRVRRLMETIDKISEYTTDKGGYVESMSKNLIIVRIPGDAFEKTMVSFSALGDLLEKEISAIEVTAQFTDLTARLDVALESRQRLLTLLEEEKNVRNRLRILEQIKRLTSQIESINSTLSTLQNLVDYFTITIELVPVIDDEQQAIHKSPFAWVQNLSAHRVTIFDGKDDFKIDVPSDFVVFSDDDNFIAKSADTTTIRVGKILNEPKGDNTFWSDAVEYEMSGRGEIEIESGTSGEISYQTYKTDDVSPRMFMIGVFTSGENLYVLEVFFPTESSYDTHKKEIVKSFKSLGEN